MRRYVELLSLLGVLFVLQTGLVPFDFSSGAGAGEASVRFATTVTHVTLPDIISNIFLYVPLSAMLCLSLARARLRMVMAWLLAVCGSAVVSLLIEWLQAYSATRVSSLIDLASNVTGAMLGASLALIGRGFGVRILRAARVELDMRPRALLLKGYVLLLLFFAAIPFSLSFDVMRLKQSVRGAVWVPFAAHDQADGERAAVLSRGDDSLTQAYVQWLRMKRWARWAAEAASFALLAWLLHGVVRDDYEFSRRSAALLTLWLGAVAAVGFSLLQLPIVSRTCDATDVVFRLIGLLTGLLARARWLQTSHALPPLVDERRSQQPARTGCLLVGVYVLYTGVIPLRFRAEPGAVAGALTSEGFLPFFAYFAARFDVMMSDVMAKFAGFGLLGALMAMWWARPGATAACRGLPSILAVCLGLSVLIEAVQLFMPVRVASLTDPILAGGGCLVGVVVQRQAWLWWHGRSRAIPELPSRAEAALRRAPELGPTDLLVTGLADPHPDAPRERVPHQREHNPGLQR